jgi:hypothetical protein
MKNSWAAKEVKNPLKFNDILLIKKSCGILSWRRLHGNEASGSKW